MMTNTFAIGLVIVLIIYLIKTRGMPQFISGVPGISGDVKVVEKIKYVEVPAKPDFSNQHMRTGTAVSNADLQQQYADLANLDGYQDYNEVAQYTSLEPEIFKSHAEYSTDINNSTSGASSMVLRSDDNYPITWIGLKRPDMRSSYASSDSRIDSSESPEQMPATTHYLL